MDFNSTTTFVNEITSTHSKETQHLGWDSIGYASTLILINIALSFAFRLQIATTLIISSLRCVIQLSVLGFILQPVFEHETWYYVILWSLVTVSLASREAYARPKYVYNFMFCEIWVALVCSVSITLSIGVFAILRIQPWWEARYIIPLLGMLLGNALSSISIGIDKATSMYTEERKKIELALSAGASKWETGRPIIVESIRYGLMPTLQSMSVIGLVSIPGMMTGQILGGNAPQQAARYQIIIMFLIAANTGISLLVVQFLLFFSAFDSDHCLRSERFTKRGRLDDVVTSFFKSCFQLMQFVLSKCITKRNQE